MPLTLSAHVHDQLWRCLAVSRYESPLTSAWTHPAYWILLTALNIFVCGTRRTGVLFPGLFQSPHTRTHTHTHTRMHRLTLRHQDKEKDRQTIYHQHLPNHITTTLNSFITTHPESTLTIEAVSSMTYMTKGVSPIGCLPVIFSNTMATCLEGSGKTQMQNVLKTRLTSQWL